MSCLGCEYNGLSYLEGEALIKYLESKGKIGYSPRILIRTCSKYNKEIVYNLSDPQNEVISFSKPDYCKIKKEI